MCLLASAPTDNVVWCSRRRPIPPPPQGWERCHESKAKTVRRVSLRRRSDFFDSSIWSSPVHGGESSSRHIGLTVIDLRRRESRQQGVLHVRFERGTSGISSVGGDFLQRDGTGEPFLGLRRMICSRLGIEEMKVSRGAGGALMRAEKHLLAERSDSGPCTARCDRQRNPRHEFEMGRQLLGCPGDRPRPAEALLVAQNLGGRHLEIPHHPERSQGPQDVICRIKLPPSKTLPGVAPFQ